MGNREYSDEAASAITVNLSEEVRLRDCCTVC